jgi:hypothetical protein
MDELKISWERDIDGYELTSRGEIDESIPGSGYRITPKGGLIESYNPLKIDGLYRRLADSKLTPEAAIEFTNRYGFLTDTREIYRLKDKPPYLLLEIFYATVPKYRQLVKLIDKRKWNAIVRQINAFAGFGAMRVGAEIDNDTNLPTLRFSPNSLLSVMDLQIILDVTGGVQLRKCEFCPNWFKFGPGTGKRETAVYCSPRCQKAHQYQKKKEAMS